MQYKLIILDLDGTTVPPSGDGMPSERVKEAIIKSQEFIKVAIASGRPFAFCKKITDDLQIEGPCVFNGGAQIINVKTGQVLFQKLLSPKQQEDIVKICLPFNYPVSAGMDVYDPLKLKEQIQQENAKVFVDSVKNSDAIKILEELTAITDITAFPTTSWTKGEVVDIHITHAEATKRHGIEKLMEILDVKKAETIGVGDHHNDMPLFASVGLKAVMGNAPQEVKNIADYIAPTLEEDGVADVIDKFILSVRGRSV